MSMFFYNTEYVIYNDRGEVIYGFTTAEDTAWVLKNLIEDDHNPKNLFVKKIAVIESWNSSNFLKEQGESYNE